MQRAHRMEQLLAYWEARCLITAALGLCVREVRPEKGWVLTGPLKHAHEMRAELGRATTVPFDFKRFIGANVNPDSSMFEALAMHLYTPLAVWNWCGSSRRVMRIEPDLQTMLEHTRLTNMTWNDLRWPFPTLALELGTPIEAGGKMFDFLVASAPQNERFISFMAIGPELEACLPNRNETDLLREVTDPACAPRKRRKGFDRVMKLADRQAVTPSIGLSSDAIGTRIEDTISIELFGHTTAEQTPIIDEVTVYAARLIANVCLWMQTLPSPSNENRWKPLPERDRLPGRAITNSANLFTLEADAYESAFARAMRALPTRQPQGPQFHPNGSRVSRSLPPHFRSGYWSRPKGLGSDPTAKKIQWTRPTIVHDELLQGDQLPEGKFVSARP